MHDEMREYVVVVEFRREYRLKAASALQAERYVDKYQDRPGIIDREGVSVDVTGTRIYAEDPVSRETVDVYRDMEDRTYNAFFNQQTGETVEVKDD